jgi:hypothetical protein
MFEQLIDYAGLFPPARLDMKQVVENYDRYRHGEHAWMLGRLICPAARMDEFGDCFQHVKFGAADTPWRISALGKGGQNAEDLFSAVGSDLEAIRELVARFPGRIVVDAYECRLPTWRVDAGHRSRLADTLARVAARIDVDAPALLNPFFEISFEGDWRRTAPDTIAILASHNERRPPVEKCGRFGAKIRTGGVTADLFPDPERVACFIQACHMNGVAFKATAGLHHPVRHFNTTVSTRMHGFLNVFGAATLAQEYDMTAMEITRVLEDEATGNFSFGDGHFSWTSRRAGIDTITAARRDLATSYGSCSFEEPIADLRELGML